MFQSKPVAKLAIPVLSIAVLLLSACSTASRGGMAYSAAPAAEQSMPAYAPPPTAMYFEDYGVNGFVETEVDNLSTFAVDVDTGAYTVARRYVTDGLLPPPDAVRVEEFVNFFDYDYALPEQGETFAIHLDAAPSPFVESPDHRIMRVGIQGYDIPAAERKDVALTFVIDVSGSMDMENRLGLVKRSLSLLVEQLRPTDAVAIVVYGSQARLVLPMTEIADADQILDAIDRLHSEGSTNAGAGLQLAYRHAWENFNPQAINRVVLASDGVANVGSTGPGSIWETIEQYADKGITMTSVGVGMGNYNDVLMEQLADMGDGFYAYVDSMDEARRLFVHDLTSTLQTIAMDAKVQVEFNSETVSAYRLVGYENRDVADDDFRDDEVDAGEIGAGHSVTALYEVELNPQMQSDDGLLATVRLRWAEVEGGEVVELARSMGVNEIAGSFESTSASFQLVTLVSEYGEVLRASEWATGASLAELLPLLSELDGRMSDEGMSDADVTELVDLVWAASVISVQ